MKKFTWMLAVLLPITANAALVDTFTLAQDSAILRVDYTGAAKRGSISMMLHHENGNVEEVGLYDRLWGRCGETFCFQSYLLGYSLSAGTYGISLESTSPDWAWSGEWSLKGFGLPITTLAEGLAVEAPAAPAAFVAPASVPEPGTFALLGLGLMGLLQVRKRAAPSR